MLSLFPWNWFTTMFYSKNIEIRPPQTPSWLTPTTLGAKFYWKLLFLIQFNVIYFCCDIMCANSLTSPSPSHWLYLYIIHLKWKLTAIEDILWLPDVRWPLLYWVKILDKGGQVDTFILDFKKAFDTPFHELLKSKLLGYAIGGAASMWLICLAASKIWKLKTDVIGGMRVRWIDSFLCYRTQWAVVNGETLEWAPGLSGIPQGTFLGQLFFSLYISKDIDSEIRLLADNCVCCPEIRAT